MTTARALARPARLAIPVLLLMLAAVLVAPPAPVGSAPVCAGDVPRELCGGRVFPEPMDSATALTFAETLAGLEQLAVDFPGWLDITTIGESFDGNDLVMVELTDPNGEVPLADRTVVLVSQSIHGNEPGGREGGVRYVEDLLRNEDPLRRDLLERVRLVQVFLNPDGWVAGDHDAVPDGDSVGLWVRGNGNEELPVAAGDFGAVDLNRNAPWYGWSPDSRPPPESEPEMQALVAEVERRLAEGQDIQASTDIHGEVGNTAAWVMLSAGEYDLQGMTQQRRHGELVVNAVTQALSDDQLVALKDLLGQLDGTAILTASSEFGPEGVGGSGTGFLGDWLAQQQGADSASISTIELFNLDVSPGLNSLTFRREIFQIYRDTVAAVMGELLDQAVRDWVPEVGLPGDVGYVVDPTEVIDPVNGVPRSPMRFFDDLQPYIGGGDLVPLQRGTLDEAVLADLAAVVVTADLPDEADVAALRDYAHGGGTVVLTDSALQDLPGITEAITPGDVTVELSDINRVDFGDDRDDPLLQGLRDIAFLLVEPATLGYDTAGGDQTPAWRVTTQAWEDGGGRTVGVIAGETGVGQLPVGDGQVTVIGQLLPPPLADPPPGGQIRYGIDDYAVLDTGYQILFNALGATYDVRQVDLFADDDPAPNPGDGGTTGGGSAAPDQGVAQEGTLTLTASTAGPTVLGEVVRLRAGVEVEGEVDATDVTVTLELPDGVRPAGRTPDCTYTPGTVSCDLGDLQPGERETTTVDVSLTRPGPTTVPVQATTATEAVTGASAMISLGVTPPAQPTGRLAGAERIATAIEVSRASFATGRAGSVVLARADTFPDALAGGTLAAATGGPLLLTAGDALPDTVAAEIDRVLPAGGTVYVLGGEAAIGQPVQMAVADRGYRTVRLGGPTRFATAARIADEVDADPEVALLATGADFTDALAAGAAAARVDGVVLLTDDERMPPETAAHLDGLDGAALIAVGGQAAAAAPDAEPLVGADRFATAVTVAERFADDATAVGIATGADFPDALAGVAHIALRDGPILLALPDRLPQVTADHLAARRGTIARAWLFGGTAALSATVEQQVAEAIGG